MTKSSIKTLAKILNSMSEQQFQELETAMAEQAVQTAVRNANALSFMNERLESEQIEVEDTYSEIEKYLNVPA